MDSNTHRHRHFVALPALFLVESISLADTSGEISRVISSVTSSFSEHTDNDLPDGMYGDISHAKLDIHDQHIVLHSGSLRIGSKSLDTVSIGKLQASVFDGGMYIVSTKDSVTIAALTSPVFIIAGDQRMTVPIGMQWVGFLNSIEPLTAGFNAWIHARMLSPLPNYFMEEQVLELHEEEKKSVSLLPETRSHLPVDALTIDTLLLPVSLAGEQRKRQDHILGVVRNAVESDDVSEFQALLESKEVLAAILSERGRKILSILLSQTELGTAMQMEILLRIADTEDMWSLASFHPTYRDIAWSLIDPEVSIESQLSRAFIFPYSLFTSDEVSDFVLHRYRMRLDGIVSSISDSSTFIDNLLGAHMTTIDRLKEKGYPRRAAHMSDTLVSLVDSVEKPSQDMKDALQYLSLSAVVDLSPLPEKYIPIQEQERGKDAEEVTKEEVIPHVIYSPQEVELLAQEMLQDAGALFTVRTGIASYAENKARVSDIFFSSPSEDRSVTFTLDVYTKIVSEIEINGQTDFPYEPSFAGFVEWVSQ